MGKFASGSDHTGFLNMKEALTAALASAIEEGLTELGSNAKGISWFSSCAYERADRAQKRAA